MSKSSQSESKWLDAFSDKLAKLYTFSSCITTADLNGDGDYKLIVADLGTGMYNMKLKTYAGTTLMSDHVLIDLPTAVEPFFMDEIAPRTAAIAVASGPAIFVYKNLKPYYKFSLPSDQVAEKETQLWAHAASGDIDAAALTAGLRALHDEIGDKGITARSARYLLLDDWDRDQFVNMYEEEPLKKQTVITCMTTVKRADSSPTAIDCIIVGAENGKIYVIDTEAFTVLAQGYVPSAPVFVLAAGMFAVDYRLILCCRDTCVYTLKREAMVAQKPSFSLGSHAVGMARTGKVIVVACNDQTLRGYGMKGKVMWKAECPALITAMGLLDYEPKNFQAVVVALANGAVRIYKDATLVNELYAGPEKPVVTSVKFGSLGREGGALILVDKSGALTVKLLKRTAKFDEVIESVAVVSTSAPKLKVPKKTKAFVDQTVRERENAVGMHQVFQRDLFLLRLTTLRAYAEVQKPTGNTTNPVAVTRQGDTIHLTAEVLGFGPNFLLKLYLKCTAPKPVLDMYFIFKYNDRAYSVTPFTVKVPFLAPSVMYPFDVSVKSYMEVGMSDEIRVILMSGKDQRTLLSAVVTMPPSEADD